MEINIDVGQKNLDRREVILSGKDNLHPPRSTEEARERGQKGGVKSGDARRKKRDMKKTLVYLLDLPISAGEEEVITMMDEMTIPQDDRNRMMALIVSMYKEATYNGNVKAAEFIRDVIGAGAVAEDRKAKLKLDRERFDMEKAAMAEVGEGMPVIINVRPQPDQDEPKPKDEET